MRSPRAFYEKMLGYDVTHLYWRRESRGNDSLAGDLVFFTFAHHYTSGSVAADAGILAALPERVPPDSRWHEWQGAVLLCPGTYQPGYYQLGDLTVPAVAGRAFPSPRRRYGAGQGAKDDFRNARFVALEPGCHRPATKLRGTFNHVAQRGSAQLWIAKQLL
jgi:hypothetical protein